MENQMKRDKQVLNSIIQRQRALKKQFEGVKKRHQKIFDVHMRKKYLDVSFYKHYVIKETFYQRCILVN